MHWLLLLVVAYGPKMSKSHQHQLTSAEVKKLVQGHVRDTEPCFQQSGASPKASATVHWTITSTGQVTDVRADHKRNGNEELESCLAEAVGRWTFPGSPNDLTTQYTFKLSAPKAKHSKKKSHSTKKSSRSKSHEF